MNSPTFMHPLFSPTVFIATGNYAKVVHSEGPVPWAGAKLSKQLDSAAGRITALLTFSFLKCWAVKSSHFTCLLTGIWITLTAQQLTTLHPSSYLSIGLVLVWFFHELFSLSSQQKSIQSSTRFLAGKQWTKRGRRGRNIRSSTNWVLQSLVKP